MESVSVDPLFPPMDASSAVYPTARVIKDKLYLAYHLPGCDDSAVVSFSGVKEWDYGYPNDEGLRSHRLWGHGLTFYKFHCVQIDNSPGIQQWIGTFHDGTFSVVAAVRRVDAPKVADKSPWEALDEFLGPGPNQVLDEPSA